jgi:hypothetical protein
MSGRSSSRRPERPLGDLIASLSKDQLREVVSVAADASPEVERTVRLIAARVAGDIGQLRAEVDRALRTRRFLDYRAGLDWARATRPVVTELERSVDAEPSRELVELLERAVAHVVRVILNTDDSSGLIGDVARDLLDLHAKACDAGVADPTRLARWMFRFRFADQDFFEADPVRYAKALGEPGLTEYRTLLSEYDGSEAFAARYARQRLAVLDVDREEIIKQHGGKLAAPYDFIRVAEAMAEIGDDEAVLEWSKRGIEQTSGWQVAQLYDFACAAHTRRGEPVQVLALRRAEHQRTPSLSSYSSLREAALELSAWPIEQPAARAALEQRDTRGFIEALLGDDDIDLAWDIATNTPAETVGQHLWMRLAQRREPQSPADALTVYQRVADEVLEERADRATYQTAAKILKTARNAADAAGMQNQFQAHLAQLREQYRRRPSLIEILNKAGLP